jgi:hypothetical protein
MVDEKGRQKYMPVDLGLRDPKSYATPEQQEAVSLIEDQFKELGLVYQATLSKRFHTTGELLAQAQDFEAVFTNPNYDFKLTVLDDGIVNHMFNNVQFRNDRGYSFVDHVKNQCPRKYPSKYPKRKIILKDVA